MFKIVDCQLTMEDNSMTAVMTLSGQGYSSLYMGTVDEMLADSEEKRHDFTLADEKHSFTVPVAALDRELNCAGLGKRAATGLTTSLFLNRRTFLPTPFFLHK